MKKRGDHTHDSDGYADDRRVERPSGVPERILLSNSTLGLLVTKPPEGGLALRLIVVDRALFDVVVNLPLAEPFKLRSPLDFLLVHAVAPMPCSLEAGGRQYGVAPEF